MAKSHKLNRREFVAIMVAFLGTIMGVVIGLPAIGYLISPATKTQKKEDWIPAGPLENYPIGIPTLFSFTRATINGWEKTVNSYGVYINRWAESEDDVSAFSNLCTHLSCRVTWHEDEEVYICPCHDGLFDEEGEVVSGPPPEPLYDYETKVEDGVLFIYFKEG